MKCQRPDCPAKGEGEIVDGFCSVCGMAPEKRPGDPASSGPSSGAPSEGDLTMKCQRPDCPAKGEGEIVDGYCMACGMAPEKGPDGPTGPLPSEGAPDSGERTAGTEGTETARLRRSTTSRTTGTTRGQLGAGLVNVPPAPPRDPTTAIMGEPDVPENRRFCARCQEPVGRSREGAPGRSEGFCRKCGQPFSFTPKLAKGDLVAGQYDVVGCLAHGGMGWIYLARDRNVSDRWVVLKGVLNQGDDDAQAAAIAERRFLAEVEHPNIVKIINFVEHDHSGYIVMEYVGGTSLKELRATGGADDDESASGPLPPDQAIAYMLAILPALGYLHELNLVFCDFKPDNAMLTRDSLKLIDLGGVYRLDEPGGSIYGTKGFEAPEIASLGPSPQSDLFTVARTLMVLCADVKGYQSTFRYSLPPQDTVSLFAEFDSLYRFLEKGTAAHPDDRFQTADEMFEQLLGVLREVVAVREGRTEPRLSTLFSGDFRARADRPDWKRLPILQVSGDDPAAGYLATLGQADPSDLITLLRAAPERTVEVQLRLARELIGAEKFKQADDVLDAIRDDDRWEWRAMWVQGIAELARERPDRAALCFMEVYRAVPGELAPKLALGVANELSGDHVAARRWYAIVSRTDPSYTTATFGLARCCLLAGDRAAALAAYNQVPEASSAYIDARVAAIGVLTANGAGHPDAVTDLVAADAILRDLDGVDPEQRARLRGAILSSAMRLHSGNGASPDVQLAGHRLNDRDLRTGLEEVNRELARLATDPAERIRLVDEANRVRPRTWT